MSSASCFAVSEAAGVVSLTEQHEKYKMAFQTAQLDDNLSVQSSGSLVQRRLAC